MTSNGAQSDCLDSGRIGEIQAKPNWTLRRLPTGAFPHFEECDAVVQLYDDFLETPR